jgi:hypothetical protein
MDPARLRNILPDINFDHEFRDGIAPSNPEDYERETRNINRDPLNIIRAAFKKYIVGNNINSNTIGLQILYFETADNIDTKSITITKRSYDQIEEKFKINGKFGEMSKVNPYVNYLQNNPRIFDNSEIVNVITQLRGVFQIFRISIVEIYNDDAWSRQRHVDMRNQELAKSDDQFRNADPHSYNPYYIVIAILYQTRLPEIPARVLPIRRRLYNLRDEVRVFIWNLPNMPADTRQQIDNFVAQTDTIVDTLNRVRDFTPVIMEWWNVGINLKEHLLDLWHEANFNRGLTDEAIAEQQLSADQVAERERTAKIGETVGGIILMNNPEVLDYPIKGCAGACGLCKLPHHNNQLFRVKCQGASGCGHFFCRDCTSRYFFAQPNNPRNCFQCQCPIEYIVPIPTQTNADGSKTATNAWTEIFKQEYRGGAAAYDEDFAEYQAEEQALGAAFGRSKRTKNILAQVNSDIAFLKKL